jgi:hypothetical protein
MINTPTTVQVRRSLDRSHHRKPLRVQITRRRTGKPAGAHQFVTQVRFGGAEAVVLPWEHGRAAGAPESPEPALAA